jgi:tetratricopeptide (TPR) repeat protein
VPPLADEFAAVASPPALALALETLAIKSEFQKPAAPDQRASRQANQRAKIRHLEARFGGRWGGIGAVAEAFGVACNATGDTAAAIEWYQRAVEANDASASMKASEQLGNMRVRRAWDGVDAARNARDKLEHALRQAQGKPGADAKRVASLAADLEERTQALLQAARAALKPIREGLALLEKLVALQPSAERESLCGSAYKRLAQVQRVLGRERDAATALAEMKRCYASALARARQQASPDLFYPASNLLAVNLVLGAAPPDAELIASVRASLEGKNRDAPDFWSMAGRTELAMVEALVQGALAAALPRLLDEHADLHARVSAPRQWASVYDQARFVLNGLRQRKSLSEADLAAAHRLERQLADYAFAPAP